MNDESSSNFRANTLLLAVLLVAYVTSLIFLFASMATEDDRARPCAAAGGVLVRSSSAGNPVCVQPVQPQE